MIPKRQMMLLGLLLLAGAVYYYWEQIQAALGGAPGASGALPGAGGTVTGTSTSPAMITEMVPQLNPVTFNSVAVPVETPAPVTDAKYPGVLPKHGESL